MTSVGDIFTSPLGEDSRLRTWIVFDGHEETLLWDTQTIPTYVSDASLLWKNNWFTAGGEARSQLGLSSSDISTSITIEYTDYDFSFGPDGLDIVNSGKLEEVIVGEIDTSKIQLVRKKLPYLNDSKLYI